MKKIFVFVMLVIMLFTGCASHLAAEETHMDALPEWDLEPIDHQPYIQNTYVTMTVSKVSRTGCTVHMINNREMIIHMGSEFSYSLQMWDGEHWCKLVPKKDLGAIGGEAVSMAERITKVRWRSGLRSASRRPLPHPRSLQRTILQGRSLSGLAKLLCSM